MGVSEIKPKLFCDNTAALEYAKNRTENQKTRHIDLRG